MRYFAPLLWVAVAAYWLVIRSRIGQGARSQLIVTLEIIATLGLLYAGSALAADFLRPRI